VRVNIFHDHRQTIQYIHPGIQVCIYLKILLTPLPPPPQSPLRRGVIRDGGRGDDGMGEAQQKERVQIKEKAMLKGFSHQIRTA
jgi:hypothetical protein